MGNEPKLNFISSTVLSILSIAILAGSVSIYVASGEPLHASPALVPGMLGGVLLASSLLLLRQSVGRDGLRARVSEAQAWLVGVARHPDTRTMVIGLLLMAIYTFVLIQLLQFWVASLIFTVAVLAFLRAARWYSVLVIAGATVGGIVVLFSVIFNIPLP
ncbi:tripartite tricarboxylate transporter TctB family protein [Georgenia satyanarayanai]|uniref:tripartite tricarboxylate transporter TctB family protein n=1 Tax=Georgenia satyanarayanai TaxID=860221 RepID=UPI00204198C8|nr:tripartite tricarboxylate transporter TctB family protein [Georgenia satyanarayanai]MCM3660982.1 tripartite tricarboxylate transporter TctB family protein [Georgenia satyanarayanai]